MEIEGYLLLSPRFNTQSAEPRPQTGIYLPNRPVGEIFRQQMSDFDSDNLSENEWEENGDLAWNEFDWEVYLREQEGAIHRYLGFYESLKAGPERIDEVADRMGWDRSDSEEVEE